ncbi:hypothetical protein ACJIZ3_021233 [Penstemon smallii]|uniref:Uncharacterized protein n=1 Tax=Penstemon smallii TaxID=265156 RepID=A0ABD3SKT8_9LAMI
MGEERQMGFKNSTQFHWETANYKKNEYYHESMKSSSSSSSSSSINDSFDSSSSLISSEELTDDASSSSSNSCGPLFELAHELMAQLPIKRGLSKFYQGKSQTFGCLGNVNSLEDLAKKESCSSYSRRMKSCKSYGGDLNRHKFGPKATITKKTTARRSISPPLCAKKAIVVD